MDNLENIEALAEVQASEEPADLQDAHERKSQRDMVVDLADPATL